MHKMTKIIQTTQKRQITFTCPNTLDTKTKTALTAHLKKNLKNSQNAAKYTIIYEPF